VTGRSSDRPELGQNWPGLDRTGRLWRVLVWNVAGTDWNLLELACVGVTGVNVVGASTEPPMSSLAAALLDAAERVEPDREQHLVLSELLETRERTGWAACC